MTHLESDAAYLTANFIVCVCRQIIMGFLVLYVQLGVSALISGLLILLVVPAQYYLAAKLGATQKLIMVGVCFLTNTLLKVIHVMYHIKRYLLTINVKYIE
jgi:hypothetical protein